MAGSGILLPAIGFGLQAVGHFAKGAAGAVANRSQAENAERNRRVGRMRADQVDTVLRNDLASTIGTIRAIAASSGAPVNSPAIEAFIRGEEAASDRDRRIAVSNEILQAEQFGIDAASYRRAARFSLLGGAFNAGTSVVQGISASRQPTTP